MSSFRASRHGEAVSTVVVVQRIDVARVRVEVVRVGLRVGCKRPDVQFATHVGQCTRRAIAIACGLRVLTVFLIPREVSILMMAFKSLRHLWLFTTLRPSLPVVLVLRKVVCHLYYK